MMVTIIIHTKILIYWALNRLLANVILSSHTYSEWWFMCVWCLWVWVLDSTFSKYPIDFFFLSIHQLYLSMKMMKGLHYYAPKGNERLEHPQNSSPIHHQNPTFQKELRKANFKMVSKNWNIGWLRLWPK